MSAAQKSSAQGWQVVQTQIVTRWRALAPRERFAAGLAALVVGVGALWALAVQPALHTLRTAPAQIDVLEVQLQRMQSMAAEARELRQSSPVSASQTTQALQSATQRLEGKAVLNLQADRAVLTINAGITGEQLRGWLGEARSGARARPVELQLTRGAQGYTGTITVSLRGAQ